MSDQNPWGGNNNNRPHKSNTPNNLSIDELMDKLKNKFSGSDPSNNFGQSPLSILSALVVIGIIWGVTGFYSVKSGEQGVVLRFGKYHATTTAGLNYHLPYPIETVSIVDMQRDRTISIGYSTPSIDANWAGKVYSADPVDERQMLTGDENIVNIEYDVRWKVSKASDFLYSIKYPEQTIHAVAESVMRETVGRNKIDYILTDGRGEIENEVKDNIQKTLNHYKSGVEILQVAIKDASAPEPVIADFEDVQAARSDAERFIQEATSYANKVLPKARGQAATMIREAEAYNIQAVSEAEGQVSRFNKVYDEYKKAPEVTKKRLYLETMEKLYSGKNKVFIAGDKAGQVIPYLPLSQINNSQKSKGE